MIWKRAHTSDDVLELWERYKATGETHLRDRLVVTLAPMVEYVVSRKIREMPPHRDVDHFLSFGLAALVVALDQYDPNAGGTLEQFAWTRVRRAVLAELGRNRRAHRSLMHQDRQRIAA
jgi:RNA polymerase sigma factor for flagellar operon FliA